MKDTDRAYFLVGADSPVMDVVRKHEGLYRHFQKSIAEFQAKHQAQGSFTYGQRSLAGLRFDNELPKGWKLRKDGCAVPDTRCNAGRELKKEFDAVPRGYDSWALSDDLGKEYSYWGDGKVYWSTVGKFGEQYVLSVPARCRVAPQGCTELKMSEYWKIREESGAGPEEVEAA